MEIAATMSYTVLRLKYDMCDGRIYKNKSKKKQKNKTKLTSVEHNLKQVHLCSCTHKHKCVCIHTHTVFHTLHWRMKHTTTTLFCPLPLSQQRWVIFTLCSFSVPVFPFFCLQQHSNMIKRALTVVGRETNYHEVKGNVDSDVGCIRILLTLLDLITLPLETIQYSILLVSALRIIVLRELDLC